MEKWMPLITVNISILMMLTITYYMNKLSNSGVFFGVRFPKKYLNEPELKVLEKSFRHIVLVLYIAILSVVNMGYFLLSNSNEGILEAIVAVVMFAVLASNVILFIPFHKKTKELKREKGWTYKTKNVVVVDTTLRKPKKDEKIRPINSKWFLLLFIFPIAMGALTLYKYNTLPGIMEMPYSNFGQFEKGTLRGLFALYELPLSQLFLVITLSLINVMIINSKVDLNSGSIEEAVIRKKRFKRLGSIMMMVMAIIMLTSFSVIQGSMLFRFEAAPMEFLFTLMLFLMIIIFIVLFIRIGQNGKITEGLEEKDDLYKDDDNNWILGSLYYNKNDPAWMVEKRIEIGWTLNFGHQKSWIAIGIVIIFIIASMVISRVVG
ncbi:DUF5808 domain-containing protein [Clostridium sp.]|uniref:DUF5808 domain-containing protein n=1 Tax=Clostridium sp. TaxID=1506 RepID=UPI003217412C